jgi:adenosine/AMP kinase
VEFRQSQNLVQKRLLCCRIFCATANPAQVLVAETDQGRGIVGVVDGVPPKGVEGEADIEWRKQFLRQIGYKL